MILNLWSTPRTGSVWYSCYLRQLNEGSILLPEIFNRYNMNIYYSISENGRLNFHEYEDGRFYEEYYLLNGVLDKKKIHGNRERTIDEEEEYRLSLIVNSSGDAKYVLHNHVEPINPDIKKYLLEVADNNFYIHRKDRRAQLGSYAIAIATKQFAKFNMTPEADSIIDKTPLESLSGLLNRIKVWDQMEKNDNIIAYEDINFHSLKGWPQKQTADYRVRLSPDILNWIDCQVDEYESSKID